jgi:1-acyl-sn-glycerol-3-phosphate acyltransferase
MQEWLSYLWYELVYGVTSSAAFLGQSFRVEGARNVPQSGAALLIANHQSFLDPPLIGCAVRRHVTFLARETLFRNPVFAWFIRSVGAVPIDQEGFARQGLKTILEQLQKGNAVLVFPEGERTPHGRMQPLKPGITLLLKRVQTAIVPIGIAGAFDAYPRGQPAPIPSPLFLPATRRTVAVSIGEPIDSRRYEKMGREETLEKLFQEIQKEQARAQRLRRK